MTLIYIMILTVLNYVILKTTNKGIFNANKNQSKLCMFFFFKYFVENLN